MPEGREGCTTDWAREKAECSAAWTATVAATTVGRPRSRPAGHQAAAAVPANAADIAHQGTAIPDMSTWPVLASRTHTAANIAARAARKQ
ncbi:hypothetical protein Slala02_54630 [Streptomyces lavendulae subsp. lavendulae]|nr:hypothetical protein Slala02_54630 [Streptomyces lavendulae subsp. lavendulae]